MVVDKPKKKSAKKAGPKAPKAAPKAPVGRPRKKLGTRVSDLPLVSTLRPRASRSNQDSMALQRARLQFKRDYPQEKGIDEFQTRALLDAMADTSRGPIGTRVLGPAQFELDKLAKKLLKAKEKNKPLVLTDDGKVFVTKKAAKKLVSSILAGPTAPAAAPTLQAITDLPVQVLTAPDAPAMFEFTGKKDNERTKSQTKRLAREAQSQIRRENVRQQEEIEAARKKRKRDGEPKEPRRADPDKETAQERELRSIKSQLERDMDPDDRMRLVQRMKAIRQQQIDGEQVDMTPYDERATQLTLTPSQETQVLRIVNQFATGESTRADARIAAEAGIKAIKAAPPVVQHAVAKALSKLPEVVPSAETVKFQNALDDLAQIAAEDRRKQLDAEEARQYGKFRPTSEQQLANQRAAEQIAVQLQQEREEEPVEFRPRRQAPPPPPSSPEMTQRRQGPRDYLLEPFTPQEQAAADIVNAAAKRNKAMKALQAQNEAAATIQAALRARRGREADRLSEYKRVIEERARKQMESTAASTIQESVRRALARDELKSRAERAYRPAQGPVYDEDAANVRDAALRIQSILRGNRARKEFETEFERNIPTIDVSDDIAREAAAKIQSAFRKRVRRRDPAEQADLDAQYAALFNRRALDEIQEKVMQEQREKAQAELDAKYAALFAEGDIDKMREAVIQTHRETMARRTPMLSDSELAVAKAFAEEVAAQREIEVPGTNIRPDTRTIPVPPPIPPLPIRYSEPVPKRTRASASVKRLEKAAAETGQSIPVMNFVRDLVTDTLRQVVDEDVASKAQARIEAQDLQEQRSRLRPAEQRVVTEEEVRPVVENLVRDVVADALFARRLRVGPDAPPDDSGEDWETDPNPYSGRGLVGGVLRRLRGMGFFNGLDSVLNPVHGTPMDNKKDLADAKAAYAARGGTFDGRTDFRVLMDAMKTLPRRQGGAMGGSVVLSGVPSPITGSGKYTLQAVTFPESDWKSSSSLRWLRSNGIKPIKKADRQGSLFRYRIVDPKGFNDYYTSELTSRGRKINLVYGSP